MQAAKSDPSILTIGELLVEFVSHRRGCGLQTLSDFSGPYPSGAPAIFVDQAARLGAKTGIVGGIGRDAFGATLLARLKRDGVGVDAIGVHADKTTGVAFVSYAADGGRVFIFHLTDTAADSVEFSDAMLPKGDVILHVSGASLGNPRLRVAILAACDAVRARGGTISCDPNARPELLRDPAGREALHRIMAASTYILPSTSDLGFLYPGHSEDAAIDRLRASGAEVVALKRGGRGALIIGGDARHSFDGHAVNEVDPTGAGDCFCGTFVALMSKGYPLAEAGRYANAAGALAVRVRGPMEGNSDLARIEAFLGAACPAEARPGPPSD